MTKHTPGPYQVHESGDKFGGFVGYIVTGPGIVNDGSDMEHAVAKRHARELNIAYAAGLAAAAAASDPVKADLLAACKGLLDVIHDDLTHAVQELRKEQIDAARAAIAKATGGAQ